MTNKKSQEIKSLEDKISMRKAEAQEKRLFDKIKTVAQGNSEKDHYHNGHGDDWDENRDTWAFSYEGVTFKYVDYEGWNGKTHTSEASVGTKKVYVCTQALSGECDLEAEKENLGITCYIPDDCWEQKLQELYVETKERTGRMGRLATKQEEKDKLEKLRKQAKKLGF